VLVLAQLRYGWDLTEPIMRADNYVIYPMLCYEDPHPDYTDDQVIITDDLQGEPDTEKNAKNAEIVKQVKKESGKCDDTRLNNCEHDHITHVKDGAKSVKPA
jgi:hypothetical protein